MTFSVKTGSSNLDDPYLAWLLDDWLDPLDPALFEEFRSLGQFSDPHYHMFDYLDDLYDDSEEFGYDEEKYLFDYTPPKINWYEWNFRPSTFLAQNDPIDYELLSPLINLTIDIVEACIKRLEEAKVDEGYEAKCRRYKFTGSNYYQLDAQGRRRARAFSVKLILWEVDKEEDIYSLKAVLQEIARKIEIRMEITAMKQLQVWFPKLPYPVVRSIMSHLGLHCGLMISSEEMSIIRKMYLNIGLIYIILKGDIFCLLVGERDAKIYIRHLNNAFQEYTSYLASNMLKYFEVVGT